MILSEGSMRETIYKNGKGRKIEGGCLGSIGYGRHLVLWSLRRPGARRVDWYRSRIMR